MMSPFIRMIFVALLGIMTGSSEAQGNGLGQTIQINARFDQVVGKPQWLLIVRDLDHGQVIPYLFDVTPGEHFWVAFTYSRHYLITASTVHFEPYRERHLNDFCQLESHGRIIRGQSLYVTVEGRLSPNVEGFRCDVSRYADAPFTVTAVDEEIN